MQLPSSLTSLLLVAIVVYVVAMYAIALFARARVHDVDDYLVAGRHLGLGLAAGTLLATWFGAGTMLTATDEVRAGGLERAALDPWGAGVCLLLAGWFFARPLRELNLVTLADFFRLKFGRHAETWSSLLLVPTYFGWVAAQLVALAGMMELFFGLPPALGIVVVAVVGLGYTLMGGMWSVTLTDAVQMALVVVGLMVLSAVLFVEVGGLASFVERVPAEKLRLLDTSSGEKIVGWLGVFCIGALGNLPGQDLFQRVFASRTPAIARSACLLAGALYLVLGVMPLFMGLAADVLLPDAHDKSTLPLLAGAFLHPVLAVVFVIAVLSAVLSTLTSAVLSPAAVLSQNVFARALPSLSPMTRAKGCVVVVSLGSLAMAYAGESAYKLLEDAYAMTLAGLFVPLAFAVYREPRTQASALVAMATGSVVWIAHYLAGWELFLAPLLAGALPLPVAMTAAALAAVAYVVVERTGPPRERV